MTYNKRILKILNFNLITIKEFHLMKYDDQINYFVLFTQTIRTCIAHINIQLEEFNIHNNSLNNELEKNISECSISDTESLMSEYVFESDDMYDELND
jgi:hypothetical protein